MSQRDDFFIRELVEELRRVEALIRQEPSLEKRIYYFSASYGITNRTFRYSFSKEVLLADILLHNVYNMLMERLNLLKSGDENVTVDVVVFDRICDGLKDLANCFESGESVLVPLTTITTAGFAITGPGNYLREKKMLEL